MTHRGWLLLIAIAVHAQSRLSFEVASVRPDKEGPSRGSQMQILPGNQTYVVTNFSLEMLVMTAYDVRPEQLSGGPNWPGSERWDIEAKADHATTRQEGRLMLQNLLADRFKLRVRREPKEVPIYHLVVDKGGPKLREAGGGQYGLTRGSRGELIFRNAPIASLMRLLPFQAGRPVEDKTGLTGTYDFQLEFAPDRPGAADAGADSSGLPDIFTALRQQLGLRLESQKGSVEYVVIEHAERPTEN